MTLAAVMLDARAAAHLTRALEDHGRWCRAQGHRVPDALVELEKLARAGHGRTQVDGDGLTAEDEPMAPAPLLLTFAEVAKSLNVSERTVRRLVERGDLKAVTVVGSRRRVAAADLVEFAEELRSQAVERRVVH